MIFSISDFLSFLGLKFLPPTKMDPSWEFQAPQFVDFNNLGGGTAPEEEDRADEFFNVDMESGER